MPTVQFPQDVSRETLDRLHLFADRLSKWNKAINLVAPASLGDLWERHIQDSAQVVEHSTCQGDWLDIGSGGGLPGLIVSAVLKQTSPDRRVVMVESDTRKSVFIRETAREMDLDVTIINDRIENVEPRAFGTISARALAPLDTLFRYALPFTATSTELLFLKGARVEDELAAAVSNWRMNVEKIPSRTHGDAVILRVTELKNAG